MASVAGSFNIIIQGDLEWLMRVGMTAQAVFKREMRFSLVAFCTLRDEQTFFSSRRMCSVMTFKTFNLSFMLGPGFINLYNDGNVAFFTVTFFECGIESGISGLNVSP